MGPYPPTHPARLLRNHQHRRDVARWRGVVKTGGVRLGKGTTVGLSAIVEIGVEAGTQCQIGALSFVPKRVKLEGNTVYAGIPAAPIHETFPRRELST